MSMRIESAIVYDVEIQRHVKDVNGGWANPGGMGMASAVTYDFVTDKYDFFLGDKGLLSLRKRLHERTVIGFNSVRFDSRVILGNNRGVALGSRNHTLLTTAANPKSLQVAGSPIAFDNIDLALLYVRARFAQEIDLKKAYRLMADPNIHDGTWSLDALAKANLRECKSGHGALAPGLWQDGKFDELLSYNFQDVRLTKQLAISMEETGAIKDSAGRIYAI